MKKRAIVLLITLGFITVITVLIMQTVTISKSSLDDLMAVKTQNQMMLLMKDFTKIIDRYNPEDFKEYFVDLEAVPISDEKSGLEFKISCISLDSRVNLNKLLKCNKKECDDFVREFAKSFDISDEEYFWAMLKDTVTNPENETLAGSKLVLQDKTFSTGDIVNFNTIIKIKDNYFKEFRDKKIYDIEKSKFFDVFYLYDGNTTDTNDSSPTDAVAKVLGCYENDASCKTKFKTLKSKFNQTLNNTTNGENNSTNQSIQTKDLIQCTLNYYLGDETHSIVFKYNLDKKSKKRVISIDEFY